MGGGEGVLGGVGGINTLATSYLNRSDGWRKNSWVALVKTGEKFSSSKSVDFSSILLNILSS